MNYLLHGDTGSLSKLSDCFQDACRSKGITISKVKATMILLTLIDDATKKGLIKGLQGVADNRGLVKEP